MKTSGGIWVEYARLYRSPRRTLVGIAVLTALGLAVILPVPLIIAYALDTAIPEGRTALLFGIGGALLGAQVLGAWLTVWRRHLVVTNTKATTARLRHRLVRKLYAVSIDYHRHRELGTVHDWVVQETQRVDRMMETLLSSFGPAALTSVGLSAVLAFINWRLYLLTLSVIPLMIVAHRIVKPRQRESAQNYRRAFARFSEGIIFTLRTMELTRLRAAEHSQMARNRERLADLEVKDRRLFDLRTIYQSTQQTLVATAGIVTLVMGGIGVIRGTLTIGELFAFYAALAMLRGPLGNALTSVPVIIEGRQSLEQVFAVLAHPDRRPYSGSRLVAFSGSVELDGVSFSYTDRRLLEDATMHLEQGRVTALIGPNGSGKSTVVNLILGLYRPDAGRLLAGGIPYDELDIPALRRQIGVVPQQPVIISGTIAENISFGFEDEDEREVERVARLAQAAGFIRDLPSGFGTVITHDGLILSGGQRQRIAIARALISNPRLLILDEPTNHLDDQIMDEMMQTLVKLESRPAVLLISHRHDVDRWADEVFRIQGGVVAFDRPGLRTSHLSSVPDAAPEGGS